MNDKTDNLLNQARQNENESSISCAEKEFDDDTAAARVFSILKTKILKVAEWNEHSLMSSYALFDKNGGEIDDAAISVGVFIRIHLKASGKYDWVRVIEVLDAPNEFVITVKPTYDPTAENVDKSVVSHFFTDESTNNFCLLKKNNTTAFYVIGLNEKQNTGETGNVAQTLRNVAVNFGSYLGIQKGEWEKFCHNFLAATRKEE